MKIVVLDGYTLTHKDLSWEGLAQFGDYVVYERTSPEEIVPRARDAEIILTNKVVLSSEILHKLPKLKYIAVTATGYNVVDIEVARERKIPVSNVPEYGTLSVSQFVFAHLLNLAHRTDYHTQTVREGRWNSSPDFCYWDFPQVELAGLTMGIVGFGRIGQSTAKLAIAFGMKVLAYDVFPPSEIQEGVEMANLNRIFRESDVVSLHCPLTNENQNLINAERLSMMKKTAFLINTSRGPLVDEKALADALNKEQIAGAGLDVLTIEPPPKDNPLLSAKNCFITPHIAWATQSARARLLETVLENIKSFLNGKPQNLVNK